MSKDTYSNNSICYLNDQNRDWIASQLLLSSITFFNRMYKLTNFKKIEARVATLGHSTTLYSSIPNDELVQNELLDDIKLIICFENFAKAKLLKKGYVIHLIDPPKKHPQFIELEELKKRQKKEPIKQSEIMKYSSFIYCSTKRHNYLEAITTKTLKVSLCYHNPKYQSILQTPQDILDIILPKIESRNTLHYLLHEGASLSSKLITEIKTLSNFVDTEIITEFNDWAKNNNSLQMIQAYNDLK